MAEAATLFEKSAATNYSVDEFIKVEESRFEDRPVLVEEPTDLPASTSDASWGSRPTVRRQMQEHPHTVRLVNPETKVLNLADPAALKEFNRIQRCSSDLEAPTLAITELEKQQHEGTWSVFVTFCEVQYMQL